MTTLHAVTHGHRSAALPVRDIGADDLRAALRAGFDDFLAMPTHVIFISLIYPIIGMVLAVMTFDGNVIPLLFPLASGFALIGPFAAVGLYELSRRRARGLDTGWAHAFRGLRRRAVGSLFAVGGLLATILVCWLVVAQGIYWALYDSYAPATILGFAHEVLTTERGWVLIVLGNLAGFAFSLITLAVSVVSVPLIVGRHVDALTALETSVAAFRQSPRTLLAWGCIVAGLLVLGSLPLFVGLAVVMPILGHATWHLYERIVAG
ncbi:DUF2189 domain-containing protein [Methylobacterium planeticum]|uniref:DUF2189 domain-containing protein n=1 Tax=Methylobacterium planeticum TaxID=2615211 RepID=A0A6N6MTP3_9HYPH|nr:DUF2189 domain-containing protein [Methylobacterium planeticum]KAB1073865.1 DUF2189 domain-containing protein [Methylobacterium planeticum]